MTDGRRQRLPPDFSPEQVREISTEVYKERLGPDDVAWVIEHKGGPEEAARIFHARAHAYDALTRAYLKVLKARGMLEPAP